MKDLEIDTTAVDWITVNSHGLDTTVMVGDDDGAASVTLNWVQTQMLYRWLKARLGE